jgi:hypothetical protein
MSIVCIPGRICHQIASRSRQDLYELAWWKPMAELAKDFGIPDVALAKQFRKCGITGNW